jgi:hypothetical protein
LFSETIYADQPFFNVIARDISINDKVVRLKLPAEGIRFKILWTTLDGKKWEKTHVARKGNHAYEMRGHPGWKGNAQMVAVKNFRNISGEVKKPAFGDEIDIYLAPEQMIATTINFLHGHTLLGYSWNIILILLMVFSAIALYYCKGKKLLVSLLFGFIIAWGIMDMRTMFDHFAIVNNIEDNQSVNRIKHLKTSCEILSEKIGTGKWTQEGLPWPHTNVVAYALAEHQYVPYHHNSKFDFLIVQGRNQLVLLGTSEK